MLIRKRNIHAIQTANEGWYCYNNCEKSNSLCEVIQPHSGHCSLKIEEVGNRFTMNFFSIQNLQCVIIQFRKLPSRCSSKAWLMALAQIIEDLNVCNQCLIEVTKGHTAVVNALDVILCEFIRFPE